MQSNGHHCRRRNADDPVPIPDAQGPRRCGHQHANVCPADGHGLRQHPRHGLPAERVQYYATASSRDNRGGIPGEANSRAEPIWRQCGASVSTVWGFLSGVRMLTWVARSYLLCARVRARVCVCVRVRACVNERERERERERESGRGGGGGRRHTTACRHLPAHLPPRCHGYIHTPLQRHLQRNHVLIVCLHPQPVRVALC